MLFRSLPLNFADGHLINQRLIMNLNTRFYLAYTRKNVLLTSEDYLFDFGIVKFPIGLQTGKKVTSGVSYQRCNSAEKKNVITLQQ